MTTPFADLETLWHKHQADMVRRARRYVGVDAAEDIVQDVFCNALRAMLKGNGYTTSASGWLYRMLHNRIVDYYRARDVRGGQLEIDAMVREDDSALERGLAVRTEAERLVSDALTPHELAEQAETTARVRRAVALLPEYQAETAFLRLEGYEYDEISAQTGRSYGASKALMTRAYANLRVRLEEAA